MVAVARRPAALKTAKRLGKIDEIDGDVQTGPLLREHNRLGSIRPLPITPVTLGELAAMGDA
jgi:hypothetical protein